MSEDELEVFTYVVDSGSGVKYYVSPVPTHMAESGGLQPHAIFGRLTRELRPGQTISTDVFAPNDAFEDFLHLFVAEYAPKDPSFREAAKQQKEGTMYVFDERAPATEEAVPSEDIIGSFEVKGGNIVPGSYSGNSKHLILTENGFTRLPAKLQRIFLRQLCS